MEKYLINPNQRISVIHKNIYGNFSEHLGRCIYEGLYVGNDSPIPNVNGMRTDVVNALREIGLPVLRWPGGCFADEYHWKDGIGPKAARKKMINTHWGGVVEDNSFGTHEFFELCRQIGCNPYITGNVGSGSVQEMSEWVEYMTFDGVSPMAELRRENGAEQAWKLPYFGVGNENWGCGGHMTAEFYADQYRRYATYVRNYSADRRICKIACGPNAADYHWTEVLMKQAAPYMDALSLHYYTCIRDPRRKKIGHALEFDTNEYYEIVEAAWKMEELVTRHSEIMNRYDPEKRISLVVDEWGTWHDVEEGTNPGFLYQQNAMRDAIVAGLTLNIFNKHSDRVRMANIAQTINVLQAVALTDGEEMLLTPTYHVFRLYREHQNNTLLGSYITTPMLGEAGNVPQLIESASINDDGTIVATIVNTSMTESAEIACQIADFSVGSVSAEILTGDAHDHNSFENKNAVTPADFTDFTLTADGFSTVIPGCSVVRFLIK
ncbi:MAG: alpha-N-arabinofuranosidase [Ruminococcaceae bacterium]|nr:alpha-N-arabinofuranosidase [Oscillospiraceae bacterium]